MLKTFGLTIAICALAQLASSAEIPEKFAEAVRAAERDGRLLFEASNTRAPKANDKRIVEARSRVSDFCDLKYEPVIVEASDAAIVYFLASVPKRQGTAFGRHYRVQGEFVTPSSRGCLILPPGPDNTSAQVVTHLLSESPNEFHVYISLKFGVPIFVGTQSGMWSVSNGKITFEQSRDGA